jgi:hypothetical protein
MTRDEQLYDWAATHLTDEQLGGLGPAFAKAFLLGATPIVLGMILMIWLVMRSRP